MWRGYVERGRERRNQVIGTPPVEVSAGFYGPKKTRGSLYVPGFIKI